MRPWAAALGLALSLLVTACTSEAESPSVTKRTDTPVTTEQLVFSDRAHADKFVALQDCICDRTDDWSHRLLYKGPSNLIREYWCANTQLSLDECRQLASTSRVVDGWYELQTTTYELPDVQGVGLRGFVPLDNGADDVRYGVNVSVTDELISSGSGSGATLVRWPTQSTDRRSDQEVLARIATRPFYDIRIDGADTFLYLADEQVHATAGGPWELMDQVTKSPEALQDALHEQWTLLASEVEAALESDQVRKCLNESGPSNDGTPPSCLEWSPLSDVDKAQAFAHFTADQSTQASLIDEFSNQLYDGLVELLPRECRPQA